MVTMSQKSSVPQALKSVSQALMPDNQDNERLQAHDCVLMFVPVEGALAAALAAEPELFTYGWNRRIVLVGTSSR
jgi:DNA anti-recombination protein RmuC